MPSVEADSLLSNNFELGPGRQNAQMATCSGMLDAIVKENGSAA
jgi:hypothetical protein